MHGSQVAGVVGAECVYPSAGVTLIRQRGERDREKERCPKCDARGAIALSPTESSVGYNY